MLLLFHIFCLSHRILLSIHSRYLQYKENTFFQFCSIEMRFICYLCSFCFFRTWLFVWKSHKLIFFTLFTKQTANFVLLSLKFPFDKIAHSSHNKNSFVWKIGNIVNWNCLSFCPSGLLHFFYHSFIIILKSFQFIQIASFEQMRKMECL